MAVDAWASQPHYVDHLAPIWNALAPDVRGRFYVQPLRRLEAHARRYGIQTHAGMPARVRDADPVLLAGGTECAYVRPRRVVLVEHGAGQRYRELDHPSYSGGPGRANVVLFCCTNDDVAAANAARYPDARAAVVGSPWIEHLAALSSTPADVVISRHHDPSMPAAPEARSAWPHYMAAIEAGCRAHGWKLHAHPRMAVSAQAWAHDRDIAFLGHFEHVVQTGYVYVCDNSSTLYAWAALDRPCVVLDAPWYRREVEHGLRFWEHADVGVRISEPDDLEAAVLVAAADPDEQAQRRRSIAAAVFPLVAGSAARAARAIEEIL